MAIDFNTVADRVFDQLKGFGYSITMNDKSGKQTANAKKARYFYSTDEKFTIIIDEENRVIKIKFGDNTDRERLNKLENTIRNGIAKKFVIGVDLMSYTGKDIEPKDVENMAKVQESLSPVQGSMKTSYQQTDGAKLIIRHSKPVNEEVMGSRSRNIRALFIENAQGERFRYPQIHLAGARTMTRHVAEGGTPYDEIGQKIIGLSEERSQLMQVARYIRSQGLQEQANDVQFAVTGRLTEIKDLLGRYNTDRLMGDVHEQDENDLDALKEKLTKNVFDETIGSMLPRLNGYLKEYQAKMEATQAFDSLKQQVEESSTIAVSAIPDLDFSSMIVYESPTVNTSQLINLVLPVLEDETIKNQLTRVAEGVASGHLDPMAVENLTRSIIGKSSKQTATFEDSRFEIGAMFESALKKYSLEEILK
jgi:hypothetical protein